MRLNGIRAKRRRKYRATTDSKHGYPAAPNLLARQFSVDRPNAVWVSDITYIWTSEGPPAAGTWPGLLICIP